MHRYAAYNLIIESEVPLPGFPAGSGGEKPDVRIRLGCLGPEPEPQGGRSKAVRFQVCGGAEVVVDGDMDNEPEMVAHCIRSSALAELLAQRGALPLHACAVASPQGAILLVGPSAVGKSTLAAEMARRGCPLISDDFTALEERDGAMWALPSGPELCLWKNSLGPEPTPNAAAIRPGVKKFRANATAWASEPATVQAVFCLPEAAAPNVTAEPMSEQAAFEESAARVYRLRNLLSRGLTLEKIQQGLTLLARGAPAFILSRPRDIARVPEACDKIIEMVAQLGPKKRRHWSMNIPFLRIAISDPIPPSLAEGRPGFALIASYPKSGNTWIRALLTSWRLGGKPSLAELDGRATYRSRQVFGEVLGMDPDFFHPDELIYWRGQLMKNRAESLPGSSPTKVHDRCVRSAADDLLYPPEATAGVIYVVRNPLDVAVSLAHHLHRPLPYAVKVMNSPDNYFCTDLAERDGNAIAPLFSQHVSSWSDHVLSWLNEPRHRRLLVRYEDLLADPKAEMKRIMELLDVPWNAEKAQAVVGFCTFSKLQSEEEKSGFWEKPPNAPNFFRKGSSGDWRSSLPPELAVRICLDHGEVMKRVGHGAEVEEVLSS